LSIIGLTKAELRQEFVGVSQRAASNWADCSGDSGNAVTASIATEKRRRKSDIR
jgi:hypothetical protein